MLLDSLDIIDGRPRLAAAGIGPVTAARPDYVFRAAMSRGGQT